nr:hypothetical protein [Stagnihabitans tardus]
MAALMAMAVSALTIDVPFKNLLTVRTDTPALRATSSIDAMLISEARSPPS